MATIEELEQESNILHDRDKPLPSVEEDEPPSPPRKDTPDSTVRSANSADSYFNPLSLSRTNSIYTLSRASFSNQLAQLTSLNLPDALSLSSSVASIPTATTAAKALSNAAVQIQRWIQKAAEVLAGLDAEDDVEWAAAGGREGLGEVDGAIGKFEGLVEVYVVAIEDLQKRDDISKVAQQELKVVVDTMEIVLVAWENVRKLLSGVKLQVELAMEWEELWNIVLGDIGLEMESLGQLEYEMEEKRHMAMARESAALDATMSLDIQELETIVEESPLGDTPVNKASHRFSLPAGFSTSSPLESPMTPAPQDDSSLLALFARMQPLRASLDFLPMRLSGFQARAEKVLPTACDELETRRKTLERKWKKLEGDAEALRRELSEDRWILAFRTAGRQVQKMCESVERSLSKLQEAIDVGAQHNNPPMLAKRIEAYEAKKSHYGPAIPRILSIIEKGVSDRRTINGEILRLHADTKALWTGLEADIRDMDLSLEELHLHKSQQLRDSMSSIVSNDISAAGSTVDTPGSSPASSVVMSPAVGKKPYISTPEQSAAGRRSSSVMPGPSPQLSVAKRSASLQRSTSLSRTATSANSTPRGISPKATSKPLYATPPPTNRPKRPTPLASENSKPRWNASPKVEYKDLTPSYKTPLKAPLPHTRSTPLYRNSRASSSNTALPSPLGRQFSASPAPPSSYSKISLPKLAVGVATSLGVRNRRNTSPSPARSAKSATGTNERNRDVDASRSRLKSRYSIQHPPISTAPRHNVPAKESSVSSTDSTTHEEDDALGEESPTIQPKLARPATAMAGSSRRSSMLPVPKARAASGRESSAGMYNSPVGELKHWK
ncbi:hypothetical protein MMC30_008885 [Trapelia coarctata]|nr:hypothetical protein [Trapelia coarctata]